MKMNKHWVRAATVNYSFVYNGGEVINNKRFLPVRPSFHGSGPLESLAFEVDGNVLCWFALVPPRPGKRIKSEKLGWRDEPHITRCGVMYVCSIVSSPQPDSTSL